MKALSTAAPARPGFGNPAAVTAQAFHRLPEAMQAEAVLLLAELGEDDGAIARRLRIDRHEACRLRSGCVQPMKPGGYADFMPAGEEA